jgi:hypothetical protein
MTGANHELGTRIWCEDMQKIGRLIGKESTAMAIVKFRDGTNRNLPDLAQAVWRSLYDEKKK